MSDNVTHSIAVAGTCAPLWGSFSLSGTLQLVSIVWITLQVANFVWSKWKHRDTKPGHDDTFTD